MSFTLKVHDYRKIPHTNEVRLVRTTPYIRFCQRDHPPIYLQNGRFYDESGVPEDAPGWVLEQIDRMSDQALQRAGYTRPAPQEDTSGKELPLEEPTPEPPLEEKKPKRGKGKAAHPEVAASAQEVLDEIEKAEQAEGED